MKKFNYKRALSLLLVLTLVLSTNITSFAQVPQASFSSTKESVNANTVIVTDNGVSINGIYYSKTEFKALLNKAVLISSNNKSVLVSSSSKSQLQAIPAAAGIYFIPGIGEIAIAVTGVIIVGGVNHYVQRNRSLTGI